LPYRTGVALLHALAHPGKLQGSHGFLVIVFHHSIFLSFEGLIGWGFNIECYDRKSRGFATCWDRMLQVGFADMLFCREAAYLNNPVEQTECR
jgi:hypothetical protein